MPYVAYEDMPPDLSKDYNLLLKEVQQLRLFVGFVESVVSNPIGSYSVAALDGIFGMMRDKIAALPKLDRDR